MVSTNPQTPGEAEDGENVSRRNSETRDSPPPPPPYEDHELDPPRRINSVPEGDEPPPQAAGIQTTPTPRKRDSGSKWLFPCACCSCLALVAIVATVLGVVLGAASKIGGDSTYNSSGYGTPSNFTPGPVKALQNTHLALIDGDDFLIYQDETAVLTMRSTVDPMNVTRLLDSSQLTTGSPLATALFQDDFVFTGMEPPGLTYSYIFYINGDGNPTYISTNSSFAIFTPQATNNIYQRPEHSNGDIVGLAADRALVTVDNVPKNGVIFYTCPRTAFPNGFSPIGKYYTTLDNATADLYSSQDIYSACDSMAFVNDAATSYFITPITTNRSTIQLFYTDWGDPTSSVEWKEGALAEMDIPSWAHFCADGELFAFQAEDGSLQSATIEFDQDPSKSTVGATQLIETPVGAVANGTDLACHWTSSTDMTIYFRQSDNSLGYMRLSENMWVYGPVNSS